MVRRTRKAGPKWGKIGAPHSAKRKRFLATIRRKANPRRRKTARRRR
jgi:hypothetical protein